MTDLEFRVDSMIAHLEELQRSLSLAMHHAIQLKKEIEDTAKVPHA